MRKSTATIFATILLIGLILPLFQMRRKPYIREIPLTGVEEDKQRAQLRAENWFSGDYQKSTEEYFAAKIGFRGFLTRTYNSFRFYIFGITAGDAQPGEENFLFDHESIGNFNATLIEDQKSVRTQLETRIRNIAKLQKSLESDGIGFLLLIAPLKSSLYGNFIPASRILSRRETRKSAYELAIPLLEKSGIRYFDARAFLIERQKTDNRPFFHRGGAHWNYYAVCLVLNEISIRERRGLSRISCEPVQYREEPVPPDSDLAELTNLWSLKPFYHRTAYPLNLTLTNANEIKPSVLIVGDSFSNLLFIEAEQAGLFSGRDFYYYFQSNVQKDWSRKPIEKENLRAAVRPHNLVIIEIPESRLADAGYGFVESYLNSDH